MATTEELKKHEFRVYLKGGGVLSVVADSVSARLYENGTLASYNFKGISSHPYPWYIDVNSIEAIEEIQ